MSKLQIGDKVQCRLYNAPEGKFYGESWIGKIVYIFGLTGDKAKDKTYAVTKRHATPSGFPLHRKEIIRRVKP